jgi:hypothetical protein
MSGVDEVSVTNLAAICDKNNLPILLFTAVIAADLEKRFAFWLQLEKIFTQ